jgi:acetylornithine deacetylase
MIVHLATRLSDLDARVDLFHDETGRKANLFATIGPDAPGGVVLSGHSDVVPVTDQDWASDPFAMVEKDAALYGRGACDMKGFIAAVMATAPVFSARRLSRPLHIAVTYDEETGCLGGRALVDELRARDIRPALAIVGEPTGMQVIEGHKGCCEYTTRFTGLEGHGSAPDRGVNAAEYAVRFATRLLALGEDLRQRAPPDSRFDPPWTTVNIGRIAGGVAHNVIAGKAEVEWEFRPVNQADFTHVTTHISRYATEELLPRMRAVAAEADIVTETIGEIAGLIPMPENAARQLTMALTGANHADTVPFGTEAGLFQQMGMDVVVCGPGSIAQAHKPDEFVSLDQLEKCLTMLTGLADTLTVR